MADSKRMCSVPGCGKPYLANGFCPAHNYHFKKRGSPTAHAVRPESKVHAWIRTHADYAGDDCLKWPFSAAPNGRGVVHIDGWTTRTAPNCMCEAAHGPAPTPAHEAAHSCGNGHLGCMNPRHLRWATRLENCQDAKRHGTTPRGTRHRSNKLSEDDVHFIRSSPLTNRQLERMFKVDYATISRIRKRKTWYWLP